MATYEQVSAVVMTMAGAFPSTNKINMSPTIDAWHKTLGHIDGNVLEAAAYELLESAKFFPTPAEVMELVRELLRDESQPKQLPMGRSDAGFEMMQKVMSAGKRGDLKHLRQGIDVSKEWAYMRNLFPNITEITIRNNWPEVAHYCQRSQYCLECGGVAYCPDNYNQTDIEIMPDGWMRLSMRRCQYVVPKKKQYQSSERKRRSDG